MKKSIIYALVICSLLLLSATTFANGIQVSNISLVNKDPISSTVPGNPNSYVNVKFDLSWNNSWRYQSPGSGQLIHIAVKTGGSGYTSNPTVTISGGGGTGATATAVRTGNVVTGFTITNSGASYTSTPTVSITGGGGSGATADAHINSWWDAAWVFVKFRVGSNDITLTGASSSGTTVTVSSTAGLRVGMPVRVTAGTGVVAAGVVISSITNATQFVLSSAPTTALSGATIVCQRIWEHARLNTLGHVGGADRTIVTGLLNPSQPFNLTTNFGVGAFIYRSAGGTGNVNFTNNELRWNYGANGVSDTAVVDIRVFAIEMVYVPQGSFFVGSGATPNGRSGGFGPEYNPFLQANNVSGAGVPFQITATTPTLQGNSATSLATNLSAHGNNWDLTGTTTATLATGFPTGFSAFYCMKYELSQGQWRDFLNSLSRAQQASRVASVAVTTTSVTNRFVMSNTSTVSFRNGIRCDATIPAQVPITFYCDLDADGIPNETTDGEWIAANFLSYSDITAYLDWSGLRPMTELEYEKACRGTQSPVVEEFAWGTASIVNPTQTPANQYTLSTSGEASEGIATFYSTTAGNGMWLGSTGGNGGTIPGPTRVGILAANSSNIGRATSGATYYGIMEMTGNMHEACVNLNATGRAYTGLHGNGTLTSTGASDVTAWPGSVGVGVRGGHYRTNQLDLVLSSRRMMPAASSGVSTIRDDVQGIRGVRTAGQ